MLGEDYCTAVIYVFSHFCLDSSEPADGALRADGLGKLAVRHETILVEVHLLGDLPGVRVRDVATTAFHQIPNLVL